MSFTLGQIAEKIGAELAGDPDLEIKKLASIETAGPGELSYIASKKFKKYISTSKASALIVPPKLKTDGLNLILADDPNLSFAKAMRMFYASFPKVEPGVNPSAVIAESAQIGDECFIGPNAVIDSGAKIGAGTEIHAGVSIGSDVVIGDNCKLFQNVTVCYKTIIGNNVVIFPNAVIGSDGFGYARVAEGHLKIPQAGIVVIGDNTEIGAGTTIDRATLGETVIEKNVIIDNLVQIAHNCKVGEGSIICAQAGLAGSTIVGKNVILAGQVGVAGHLTIGDGAIIEAQSGIATDIPSGSVQFGSPSREAYQAHKITALLGRLPDYIQRLKKIEKYIDKMK